jgi:hypothetical protein
MTIWKESEEGTIQILGVNSQSPADGQGGPSDFSFKVSF